MKRFGNKWLVWNMSWMIALAMMTTTARAQQVIHVPMIPSLWVVKGTATFSKDAQLHQPALAIEKGSVALRNTHFADGTISFDVKFAGGISGITFRQRGDTSDVLYFRPGVDCPVSDDCIQYMPRDHGIFEWDLYGDNQARGPIRMGAWNHITLVVSKRRLNVFVNGGKAPALVVDRMAGAYASGDLEFHGAAAFANLVLTPGKVDGLVPQRAPLTAVPDRRFLRHWVAAKPFVMPSRLNKPLGENIGIAPSYAAMPSRSTPWRHLEADSDGLLNLTRAYGEAQTGHAIIGVWLKTVIDSDRAQVKQVAIGWTREAWVFVNGKQVFASRNLYGVPGESKNPDGRLSLINGSFALPLRKGKNEVAVALDDNFAGGLQHFGWGLEMRLDDVGSTSLDANQGDPSAHPREQGTDERLMAQPAKAR
jgi:hypothetical protein